MRKLTSAPNLRHRQTDVTGNRYGKLVAVAYHSGHANDNKWTFKCDCGITKQIRKGNVVNGKVRSCGCSKKGSGNGRWKGGEITDGHGRVVIYSPDHPNPSYNGTHVYRYRLVIEKHLGRILSSDEIVHHINGDHLDDRLENLQVMSRSDHIKVHYQEMRKAQNNKKKIK